MKNELEVQAWLNRDRSKQITWRGGNPQNSIHLYQGLLDMVTALPIRLGKMVEIGSYEGESTELFALLFDEVVAVDRWTTYHALDLSGVEKTFDVLLSYYTNIQKIKADSVEASEQFQDGELDFVYIDGSHEYENVKRDILAWKPKIRVGGYIGGHDYSGIPSVTQAVDECLGVPDKTFMDNSWFVGVK